MDWKQNKTLFNHIIKYNYIIRKDSENNNILYINYNNRELKCKYLFLFTVNNDNKILWSCDNPYIDQKTKYISYNLKDTIYKQDKNIKINFFNDELINILKLILKNHNQILFQEEKIILLWYLVDNMKNYKQFYIITEIIYYN